MYNEVFYGLMIRLIFYFYIFDLLLFLEIGVKFGLYGIRIDCVCDLIV